MSKRRREKRAVELSNGPRGNGRVSAQPGTKTGSLEKHAPANAPAAWSSSVLFCMLLVVFTSVIYGSIGQHPFVNYDDATYLANPNIQEGLNWKTVSWACTQFYASNWHPLTWLVHAVDLHFFGYKAGLHHLVGLGFHLLNVCLVFLLLDKATGQRERSLLVAGLFAVHPLNVESVAWAAELKNVLCTFFFLLALGAYGHYARKPSVWRYLLVAAMFLLGLASKPMVITLPFVLLLLDFWPLRRIVNWSSPDSAFPLPQRSPLTLVLEKLPLFAMSAGSGLLTLKAQSSGGSTNVISVSLIYRLENALHSYAVYVWKVFWPSGLAPFYPFHVPPVSAGLLVLSGAFLLAVSYFVWQARREKPYLVTGWLWYLGTLVPVIGLLQVGGQAWADRYAYIPLMGVLLMIVWSLGDFAEQLKLRLPARVALASVFVAVFSILTLRQVGYWKSSYDLWTHTLEVTEGNAIAERNLAMELMRARNWTEAAPHLLRANQFDPTDIVSLVDLGAALAAQGRDQEAVQQYETAVRSSSDPRVLLAAYRNLGFEYQKLGSDDKAEASYREALHINPREMGALEGLGRIIITRKVDEMSRTLAAHPTPSGYFQYGRMLEQSNRLPEAKDAYEKALKLDPKLADARQALNHLSASPGKR